MPLSGCGTAITTTHLNQLRATHPGAVALAVFAFDADTAGRAAAARSWDLLTDDEAGVASALVLPDGTDAAQLVQNGHGQALADRLNQPQSLASVVVDAALDRHNLETVEGRVNALRAAPRPRRAPPRRAAISCRGAAARAPGPTHRPRRHRERARHRARRTRLLTRAADAIPRPTAQPG